MSRARVGGGAAGLRTALLVALALLAGWAGTVTASAASALGPGTVLSAGSAPAAAGRPGGVRPGTGRPAERAAVGQAITAPGAAAAQPDRLLPGPVPALPAPAAVLIPLVGAGGPSPTGPPQVDASLPPAAVRGRAPPLLVSPAPDQ